MEHRTAVLLSLFLLGFAIPKVVEASGSLRHAKHAHSKGHRHGRQMHQRQHRILQDPASPAPASPAAPAGDVETPAGDLPPAADACAQLCAEDEGMEKDTCMTECATHTDNTVPEGTYDNGLENFVTDKVYNEQVANTNADGVPAIAETYSEMSGVNASDFACVPTVSPEDEPKFPDVDLNGDGAITKPEAIAFGEKMCEPSERMNDLFNMADTNQDGVITPDEFAEAGEDTAVEHSIDETIDEHNPGEDEYAECDLPKFEYFDKDKDGFIHEWEFVEATEFELERRMGGQGMDVEDPAQEEALNAQKDKIMEEAPAEFKKLDTDGDGKLTPAEWNKIYPEGSDLGDQVEEQAVQEEDDAATDLDDLSTVAAAGPAPAPALLQQDGPSASLTRRFLSAQKAEASFLGKFQHTTKVLLVRHRKGASTHPSDLCRFWSGMGPLRVHAPKIDADLAH